MTPTAMTDPLNPDLTPIQQFYKECNIFITGGTGFLGKVLLNKILSSCPGIENIYLLVRSKRGKDVNSRVEEIFEDPVRLFCSPEMKCNFTNWHTFKFQIFKSMKEVCPKYRYLVQGVSGDCLQPGLGISDQDRETLINKVCFRIIISWVYDLYSTQTSKG